MAALATFWAYVKKYWGILVLVLGAILGIFLFRRQQSSFGDQLQKINDAHAVELKQINDAMTQEQKQHDADEAKLQATMASIQTQFDAAQKQLDDDKKAQVTALVKQYSNDPDTLAQKLSDATGFKVILPQQ